MSKKIKTNHGGKRKGAGRKSEGKEPKKRLPIKVSAKTRKMVKDGAEKTGKSQAKFVEKAIKELYKSI